eukprot:COSAG06_NODE_51897_length_309_cov_0.738095_2_plen_53_part_01
MAGLGTDTGNLDKKRRLFSLTLTRRDQTRHLPGTKTTLFPLSMLKHDRFQEWT